MSSLPSPSFPVAPRAQLRDDAAAYVRELIVSGQVAPGTVLRLAPLAERIGASITPVREALLLLSQDGWVVQEPNRGFRVAPITRRDVGDAYLVQSFVAGELTARAAAAIDPATIALLRQIDEEIQAHEDDEELARDANWRLHETIYEAGASPRLTWFVNAASRFVPRRFWTTIPGWLEHNRTGHSPIIDALAAGDAAAAQVGMRLHIVTAGELLLTHLDGVGFWDH